MKSCERCGKEHDGLYGSGRFCSESCSRKRNHSEEDKKRRSDAIKRARANGSHDHVNWSLAVSRGTTGKFRKIIPNSVFELSRRTVSKIIHRLEKEEGIGCCICGWNQGTCHIHHIDGRCVPNPHNHRNLSLLCPNCHCLVHEKKIEKHQLINLVDHIGEMWKKYYFG